MEVVVSRSTDGYSYWWYNRSWDTPSKAPSLTVAARLYDPDGQLVDTKTFDWK